MLQVLMKWAWFQRSQWKNREELARVQRDGLRNIVEHAYQKVPFYRKVYDEAGVGPSNVRDVDSIVKLPVLNKTHFRKTTLVDRTASGVDLKACMQLHTSGMTGPPVTVLEDPYGATIRDALILRFLWAYGVRPGNRICRVSLNPRGGTGPYFRLADQSGLYGFIRRNSSKQMSMAATEINDHINFFSTWEPDVIISSPSYFRALARFCETADRSISFKRIVSSFEMLDPYTRNRLENKFNAEVFDHYGTEETGPLAWECPTHSGYHINSDSVVMEFLIGGKPVNQGSRGEVHVTAFHRLATPVIRYSTDDVAVPSDEPCSCGRNLPMIKTIEGRIYDFILTTDGRHISPWSIIYHLERLIRLDQYKIVQESDLSIKLLLKPTEPITEQCLKDIEQGCKDMFGETPFALELTDRIEEKHKFRPIESHAVS
jgi:phenylacetate-CoA ligase